MKTTNQYVTICAICSLVGAVFPVTVNAQDIEACLGRVDAHYERCTSTCMDPSEKDQSLRNFNNSNNDKYAETLRNAGMNNDANRIQAMQGLVNVFNHAMDQRDEAHFNECKDDCNSERTIARRRCLN